MKIGVSCVFCGNYSLADNRGSMPLRTIYYLGVEYISKEKDRYIVK